MHEKILNLIYVTLDEYNEQLSDELQLEKSSSTKLFGQGSSLDSLGLVNLIVAIEQNLEDGFETSITLADEKAMSQKRSPFRTVGSLTDYIKMLLEGELND